MARKIMMKSIEKSSSISIAYENNHHVSIIFMNHQYKSSLLIMKSNGN